MSFVRFKLVVPFPFFVRLLSRMRALRVRIRGWTQPGTCGRRMFYARTTLEAADAAGIGMMTARRLRYAEPSMV